jgi:hypothetical protein
MRKLLAAFVRFHRARHPAMSWRPSKSAIRALAVGLAALVLVSAAGPTIAGETLGSSAVDHLGSSPSSVVAHWNTIAMRTIATEGLTPIPASPLYLSFTSVAMYDAVVSIKGGFEPYALTKRPPRAGQASAEVAAGTAAYTVLRHYFSSSAANLDQDYAAFLAQLPDGRSKDRGIVVGQAAAQAIIDRRVGDGIGAAVTLPPSDEVGVWRPTPPAMAPMAVPWLGFVRPLVLRSPNQIPLRGPDDLDSAAYARDFREVKRYGAVDSTVRTAKQTETALFWNDSAVAQFQATMRSIAAERGLGLVDSSRMFAFVNTAMADSLIGCWRAKYDDAYWRPITAIHLADTDGNPATAADPSWTPLAATPPYPEYPSGHACIVGSVVRSLGDLLGSRRLDLDVSSAATGTSRHFDTASQLNRETMNARIWLGIHFRRAMTDGNRLGQETASYVVSREFQPVDR